VSGQEIEMEKPRILVVDDEYAIREGFYELLADQGYRVELAANGLEAKEKVKKKEYNLIFLDIKMPKLNGVDTFEAIKEIRPDAIIVMMTGFPKDSLLVKALEGRSMGILYKPLDIGVIMSTVEAFTGPSEICK
jgi:DNA-binding NtrC family response regulator